MCRSVEYGLVSSKFFRGGREADVALPPLRIFRSSREHWHEPLQENRDRLPSGSHVIRSRRGRPQPLLTILVKHFSKSLEFLSE